METQKVKLIGFFVIFSILLVISILMLWPFLKPIATSALLSILVMPLFRTLKKGLRSRTISASICIFIIVIFIFLPTIFISYQLIKEAQDLAVYVKNAILQDNFVESLKNSLTNNHYLAKSLEIAKEQLHKFELDIYNSAYQALETTAKYLASNSILFAKNLIWFIVEIFIMFATTFFMLRDSDKLIQFIRELSPFTKDETQKLFNRIKATVKAAILGSILVSIIQGIMGGFAFWLLGLPSPLFWGVLMIIVGIMPVVGPSTVWIPAAIILAINGEILKAIILVLWGSIVMGIVDNLLRPIFVSKGSDFHPLLAFFSIFGGVILMGPIGFFLGPIILSMALTTLEFVKERYKD